MRFDEVIGQKEVKRQLLQLVAENRVPHAMMLCGPEGVGKKALALAFASFLLGDFSDEEAQDERLKPFCSTFSEEKRKHARAMLQSFNHPDLHITVPVVKPAGASSQHHTTTDDYATELHEFLKHGPYFNLQMWSDQFSTNNKQLVIYAGESDRLIRDLMIVSNEGGYKCSIIWLPERMNLECANKLLKLIEEPPEKTVFIMVCEDPSQLLETIRSRVQRFDVPRLDSRDIEEALIQRRGVTQPDVAHGIARVANGNWLKALEMLDKNNENLMFLDLFMMLMRLAYMRNAKELKKWSESVAGFEKAKQDRLLDYFLRMVRENFMYNFHDPSLCYMTTDEEAFASKFSPYINEANIVEMYEAMQRAKADLKRNANQKMVFFVLALRVIMLLMRK